MTKLESLQQVLKDEEIRLTNLRSRYEKYLVEVCSYHEIDAFGHQMAKRDFENNIKDVEDHIESLKIQIQNCQAENFSNEEDYMGN